MDAVSKRELYSLNIPNSDPLSFGPKSNPMQNATEDFKTFLSSIGKLEESKMCCDWEDAW